MVVIKWIFIICMMLYTLDKICGGIANEYEDDQKRIVNLIEMVFGIMLTLIIFKF